MRIKSGSVRSRVEEFRESAMGRASWPLPPVFVSSHLSFRGQGTSCSRGRCRVGAGAVPRRCRDLAHAQALASAPASSAAKPPNTSSTMRTARTLRMIAAQPKQRPTSAKP